MRKTTSYTPKIISVLANDSDPDGSLNPASVSIVAAPNKGGTVAVNADGTVSYTPKLKFRGKETFKYTVRDQAGALSNARHGDGQREVNRQRITHKEKAMRTRP